MLRILIGGIGRHHAGQQDRVCGWVQSIRNTVDAVRSRT